GTNPPEGMTVSTPGSPACTVVPSGRLTVMLDAPLDENVTRLIVESTGTVSVFVPVLRSPATLRTSTPLERTTKSASFVMLPASARESTTVAGTEEEKTSERQARVRMVCRV